MVNENRIGVIGAGTMGAGIAQVAVQGGFDTVVYDISQEFVDRGLGRIRGFIGRAREKGNIDEAEEKRILSRLKGSLALEDLADATLVIEAATENLDIKRELFVGLEAGVRRGNTAGHQHLVAVGNRHRRCGGGRLARAGHAFLQSRAAHEAGGGGAGGAHQRRHGRQGRRHRQAVRQDAGPRQGHAGIHRQPHRPAVLQRGAADPERRRGGRRDRGTG